MIVVPSAVSLDELTALTGVGGPFNAAVVKLFQNDYTPTVDSVVGDFTEADYTGYAASAAIVWGAPFIDPVAGPLVLGDLKSFPASGPFTVPNDIFGFWIESSGGDLLWAERFDTPVTIANATDNVVIVPQFGLISQSAA